MTYLFQKNLTEFTYTFGCSSQEKAIIAKMVSLYNKKNLKEAISLGINIYKNIPTINIEKRNTLANIIKKYLLSHYIDNFLLCKGGRFNNPEQIRSTYNSAIDYFFTNYELAEKCFISIIQQNHHNPLFATTIEELNNLMICCYIQ